MNAIINTIPKFTKTKRKQKAASTLVKIRAIENKQLNAQSRINAELVGWDRQSKLKNQIIQLRELGVAYIDISELTGASVRYVRNLCWELGMTNDTLQNKR